MRRVNRWPAAPRRATRVLARDGRDAACGQYLVGARHIAFRRSEANKVVKYPLPLSSHSLSQIEAVGARSHRVCGVPRAPRGVRFDRCVDVAKRDSGHWNISAATFPEGHSQQRRGK